ncbi:S8 family serine peptidase [Actinomycetospora termitidis]|uniref:S8 family serine peptidase n=1 Tax=Actinomycetospora termitidis TaxID=3053470 RepID=A0ABT7MIA3_9PSEU|nr:S8 family serine peptidase [Actinomycetospora sp. Odt1-22]MDL5159043.1 S8 family serine peptidase [Actinomycetospora sp. Odt1-22]
MLAVEPERVLHALTDTLTESYTAGYAHGAADLAARLSAVGAASAPALPAATAVFQDNNQYTWGLQAVCVTRTKRTGQGITIAVLDTGFDLDHPDFAGRAPITKSFVTGQAVQDGNGHGTHCIGTSSGPSAPAGSRRYGVAPGVRILAGKVLNNAGSGNDQGILAGIEWAITQGATIISMSLGADVREVSQAYENVGRRALAAGSLIIAAAGNAANRPGDPAFVGIPANSPSIMAVASLDADLGISFYSSGSNPVAGGQIDIAGPGRNVYSSWPMPKRYNTISGTSMATPHVSGVAALWSEATGHTGRALWSDLTQHATRLPLPSSDVGAGLVQAPA